MLLALGDEDGPGAAADLAPSLSLLGAVARQRALIAVVSDFRGPRNWRAPPLSVIVRGRGVMSAVVVVDVSAM